MTGRKDMGGKTTGTKDNQETGGKGDMLMGKQEIDNMLPSDTTAGQTVTEGNRHESKHKQRG